MPFDFELPEDLVDSVEVVYLEDEELESFQQEANADLINDEDMEPPEDNAKITFTNHRCSVFCVNFNSTATLAVTGGEDDAAFMWDVLTGTVLLECTGHKDSVTAVSFSHDDKYLVTGDMNGLIQVWDVSAKNLVWCYEGIELEWCLWHHAAHVLFAGVHSGEIYMWQIPQGNCKVFPTNGSICNCGVLMPNGTQIITGYEDGSIRLWDLKTMAIISQLPPDGNGGVTSINLSADGKLFVVCGMSMGALILKTSDCKPAATLKTDENQEVETAVFCPEPDLPIVATGSLNGEICFWDISRQALRHHTSVGSTITNMIWGPNAILYASAVDGIVYIFSGRSGQIQGVLTGHVSAILDVQLSKDFKLMLTGSDDTSAKIFDIQSSSTTIQ